MNLDAPYYNRNTPIPKEKEIVGNYQIKSKIVSTNCSIVYHGIDLDTHQEKALKFIKVKRDNRDAIKSEIDSMKASNHPNIIKMDKYFRHGAYMCIVTPYAKYTCLHNFVVNNFPNGIPEKVASSIFVQMVSAVKYLHQNNIWHRDIKPSNFLVFGSDPYYPKIALSDFGSAQKFLNGQLGDKRCGTYEFMAPEMFKGTPYDNSIDIWSLGISLYFLLSAKLPFVCQKGLASESISEIISGKINYSLLKNRNISDNAINLIKQMCGVNPSTRITAEKLLENSWFASCKKKPSGGLISTSLFESEEYLVNENM